MRSIPARISRLKDELFSTENSVCLERARIFTRIYAENGDDSPGARTSRALAEVFDTMPVFIRPGELIVGQRSSKLGARILYPEYCMHGLEALGREAVEFWRTRTLGAATRARHPRALTDAESELAAGYQTGTDTGFGHMIADYPKVLTRGLGGIIGDAEHALAVSAGDEEGVRFLDSVITVCRAVVRWANRYAALCMLPVLADSVVVFDEVHSFDNNMFRALERFPTFFDVPALCMTASLPADRVRVLRDTCNLETFPRELERFADLQQQVLDYVEF